MCIYCRNRKTHKQTTALHKHSHLSRSSLSSQSSFSSTLSSPSPSFCSKHKHTITNKIHFPISSQHIYTKPNSPTLYKTTGFISSKKYQKVPNFQLPNQIDNAESQYYQYRKVGDGDMVELRRELNDKNRRIEELIGENRRLTGELRNLREHGGKEIELFVKELKNGKQDGDPLLTRQNKKIQLLLGEFERLKNQNGEKFKEVKKEIGRMRSVGSGDRVIIKEGKERSRERVKEVVIQEERCLRWKNNFIQSFLDMMERVAKKEGVELDKSGQMKGRVKSAWRYMKGIFRQEWAD